MSTKCHMWINDICIVRLCVWMPWPQHLTVINNKTVEMADSFRHLSLTLNNRPSLHSVIHLTGYAAYVRQVYTTFSEGLIQFVENYHGLCLDPIVWVRTKQWLHQAYVSVSVTVSGRVSPSSFTSVDCCCHGAVFVCEAEWITALHTAVYRSKS